MTIRPSTILAAACTVALAACAAGGSAADVDPAAAAVPLPTVGGVGVLPSTVPQERTPLVVINRPVREDGTTAELVGEQAIGNRVLVIGDSIMAGTATRYGGYMCDELVPLGWAVQVEAERSQFIDFGNRVIDKVVDPVAGTEDDWDVAAVFLGTNYGRDQERYEAELRMILTRLAPRPTMLYTVSLHRPEQAEVNETIAKLAGEFDNVTVIDWQPVSEYPGVLSADDIHPTDDGRRVLVEMTAAALGPATLGEGECLKSVFTNDSRGGGTATEGSSGGSGGSGSTTRGPGVTTTTPGGGGGGSRGTTVPPTTGAPAPPPQTSPPTTGAPPPTSPPTTGAPPVTAPPVTAQTTAPPGPPQPEG